MDLPITPHPELGCHSTLGQGIVQRIYPNITCANFPENPPSLSPSHPSWMFSDFPFTGGLAWVRDEVVHRTGQSIGWIPGWILLRQCSSPIKSTEQLEDRGRWLVIFCCYSRGLGQVQGWNGIGLWIPRTAAVAASNVERAFPINTSAGKYTDRLDDVDWWTGGA